MWWVFPNATAANNAQGRVSSNMGIPVSPSAVTRRWADVWPTRDAKFAFPRPEARHRGGVAGQEEQDRPNWPNP
jgi:hypothetical protein